MKTRWAATAAAIAILIGGAVTFALTGSSAASSLSPANQRVCAHILAQKHWFENLKFPTIADAFKLYGYVAADAAEADGHLRTDLNAGIAALRRHGATSAIGAKVARDCRFG